jgi:CheY-like chemotaxis protein
MKAETVKRLMEIVNGDARNAMHSILGFLELVSEGPLDPSQREYIEACRVAADRHFRGIEDIRVILGHAPGERPVVSDFAPGDLFARLAEIVGILAGHKGIGLFCAVDGTVPPVVSADLDRIGHALLRLAEAVMSILDGGNLHLNLQSSPDGTELTLEIRLPSRSLPLILISALERDEFEFDASISGSGALGFAAARNLALALGGRVNTQTDSSAGTRIAVTLPVRPPTGAALPRPNGAELSHETQRALRILIAEDSEDSFQLFKAFLQGQPHAVARASNGAEAVELASTGAYDLVFMDICMPVMDGYAATRQIRKLETGTDRARMPIVVLSAEDLRAQRRQGALVGCSGHLSKPLRKNDLLQAIRVYSMLASPVPVSTGSPER